MIPATKDKKTYNTPGKLSFTKGTMNRKKININTPENIVNMTESFIYFVLSILSQIKANANIIYPANA